MKKLIFILLTTPLISFGQATTITKIGNTTYINNPDGTTTTANKVGNTTYINNPNGSTTTANRNTANSNTSNSNYLVPEVYETSYQSNPEGAKAAGEAIGYLAKEIFISTNKSKLKKNISKYYNEGPDIETAFEIASSAKNLFKYGEYDNRFGPIISLHKSLITKYEGKYKKYKKAIKKGTETLPNRATVAKQWKIDKKIRASNKKVEEIDLKDSEVAITVLDKAIELNPSALNYNQRAAVKRESGDPKGAIEDYNKALTFDPNYITSIGGRGTAKSYLKDMDGACADWKKAVVIGGNESAQKQYQAKIDENCMNKEKAIAKLKELKELLYLEIITQEDYDKEKKKLSPFIIAN